METLPPPQLSPEPIKPQYEAHAAPLAHAEVEVDHGTPANNTEKYISGILNTMAGDTALVESGVGHEEAVQKAVVTDHINNLSNIYKENDSFDEFVKTMASDTELLTKFYRMVEPVYRSEVKTDQGESSEKPFNGFQLNPREKIAAARSVFEMASQIKDKRTADLEKTQRKLEAGKSKAAAEKGYKEFTDDLDAGRKAVADARKAVDDAYWRIKIENGGQVMEGKFGDMWREEAIERAREAGHDVSKVVEEPLFVEPKRDLGAEQRASEMGALIRDFHRGAAPKAEAAETPAAAPVAEPAHEAASKKRRKTHAESRRRNARRATNQAERADEAQAALDEAPANARDLADQMGAGVQEQNAAATATRPNQTPDQAPRQNQPNQQPAPAQQPTRQQQPRPQQPSQAPQKVGLRQKIKNALEGSLHNDTAEKKVKRQKLTRAEKKLAKKVPGWKSASVNFDPATGLPYSSVRGARPMSDMEFRRSVEAYKYDER